MKIIEYKKAKEVIQSLNITSKYKYRKIYKSKLKKLGLPEYPEYFYHKNDGRKRFLGHILSINTFQSYKKAKHWANKNNINGQREWRKKCPDYFPIEPNNVYKKEWNGWKDFLDTKFLPFDMSRRIVRKKKFKSRYEFEDWLKTSNHKIPKEPNDAYKNNGWTNWNDFLGKNDWKSFEVARKIVRKKKFGTIIQYKKWIRMNRKKIMIPVNANYTYTIKKRRIQ